MKRFLASRQVQQVSPLIHPFLFAIFPILFLYAHNMGEALANQIIVPLLFSVSGTLLLWFLLSIFLKSTLKAAVATTIFIVLFFSYGRLYDLLLDWNVIVPRHAYLFPAALLVWGYCVYFLKIAQRDFRTTTKLLNIVAVALISANLASIALHEIRTPGSASGSDLQQQNGATTGTKSGDLGTMPDIYYIILDEYAHPDTVLDYYDYDNSQFIHELVGKGFFIASNSRTVTPCSNRSIASSLNMEYIPYDEPDEVCNQKIANSAVADYLKSLGYKYVYFPSYFRYEGNADLYYNFYDSAAGSAVVGEFPRTLWNTTMARPFYDHLTRSVFAGYYRCAVVETIEHLKTMPNVEGPKFVFAHILCPHAPFVFGPNGEYVDPINESNYQDKQFYLGQYRFITREIRGVVEALLQKSKIPPIIVLQSDHGKRPGAGLEIGSNEWQKILNAYYLPGSAKEDLHDSISPVNSFRVILNHYFGTHFDLLEDSEAAQVEWTNQNWEYVPDGE